MVTSREIVGSRSKFSELLEAAARVPGVRIDRASYLRSALRRYCSEDQVQLAVADSPAEAGISLTVITEVANASIAYETARATGLSTVAGIPGGLAVLGTAPVDMAQYVGHLLRVAQKLAYIYSWPDLFAVDGDGIDEATEGILTLFVGVMAGVQVAQSGVNKVASMVAAQLAKTLPRKALTKGVVYPVVKKVAAYLGVRMTETLFAGGIAKVLPVIGAALSGGLTLGTFLPMCKRLQRHLASLELTKPGLRTGDAEPTDR